MEELVNLLLKSTEGSKTGNVPMSLSQQLETGEKQHRLWNEHM